MTYRTALERYAFFVPYVGPEVALRAFPEARGVNMKDPGNTLAQYINRLNKWDPVVAEYEEMVAELAEAQRASNRDKSTALRVIADRDRLAAELAEANRRALESSMLAFKWMAAHDKRAAGEVNYEYPAPADVPTCITERDALRAQVEGLKSALEQAVKLCRTCMGEGGWPGDKESGLPQCPCPDCAPARAALAAGPEQRAEQPSVVRSDAERYRWLRGEHDMVGPVARVVWKFNSDRYEHRWADVADGNALDEAIDAAIARASSQTTEGQGK